MIAFDNHHAELVARGFTIEGTGGNCTAWVKTLDDGRTMVITQSCDATLEPMDDDVDALIDVCVYPIGSWGDTYECADFQCCAIDELESTIDTLGATS